MIGDADVALPLAPGAFRKYRMSFVHQHLGLIPSLTVLDNLLLGRLAERDAWAISWAAERRAAARLFASYDIELDPDARVADIAPVERALLAIVRAVEEMNAEDGVGAGLLVLDEPTPFLPKRDVDRLFRLVRAVVAKDASVIFVSHDVDEVMEITDRATVLRDGRVAATIVTANATKADFIEADRRAQPSAADAPCAAGQAGREPRDRPQPVRRCDRGFLARSRSGRSRRRDRTDRLRLRRGSLSHLWRASGPRRLARHRRPRRRPCRHDAARRRSTGASCWFPRTAPPPA